MLSRRFTTTGALVAGGVVLAVIVAVLIALPIVRRNLASQLEATLDEALLADTEVGDVGLGLFSDFPNVTLRIDDFRIVGLDRWEGIELVHVDRLEVCLGLGSLFRDTFNIRRIGLLGPRLDMRVAEDGASNLDLFPEEDVAKGAEAETGRWAVDLDDFEIADLTLDYADRATGVFVTLRNLDAQTRGTLSDVGTRLDTEATLQSLTAEAGGVTWVRDTAWKVDAAVEYEEATGAIRLFDNAISVNALTVSLDGSIVPRGADTELDLTLSTADTTFASLLSLVPDAYSADFGDVDADGTLALAGTVKGTLEGEGDGLPAFDLSMVVANGRAKFPDQPVGLDRVDLIVKLTHPQGGPDLTTVDVRRFAFTGAGSTFEGTAKLTRPVSNPTVDLVAKGHVDLAKLDQAFPGSTEDSTGIIDVDVKVKGASQDFTEGNAERISASGEVRATDLVYRSADMPVDVTVEDLDFVLAGASAELKRLAIRWPGPVGGRKRASDLTLTGQFEQFVPYFLGDGTLIGRMMLSGSRVDVRPLATSEEASEADAPSADPAPDEPVEGDDALVMAVPERLDVSCDLVFERLLTDAFQMRNVRGRMEVKDQAVDLTSLTGEMLGGEVVLSGRYAAATSDKADIDFQVETVRFDLGKLMAEFDTLKRIAPVLRGAVGQLDSNLSLATPILADGSPVLSSLASQGKLETFELSLQPQVLQSVSKQLGRKELATLDLTDSVLRYRVEGGELSLRPFLAKLGGLDANVSGTASLVSETLDLKIDTRVPTAGITQAPFVKGLKGAVPEALDLRIAITGGYDAPKVRLDLQGAGEALADAAKEALGDKLDEALERGLGSDAVARATERGDRLVAEAKAQAEELRSEARAAAKKIRAEGRKRSDQLLKEAEGNPLKQALAKKGAEAATREANKLASKTVDEADEKADALVKKAEDRRARIIEKAGED